jgi:uncharacterized membrane protein YdbT with pleckstrin-like domain
MEEFELEPGEQITRAVRQHWIVLVINMLPFVIFALLPLGISPLLSFISSASPHASHDIISEMHQLAPWLRFMLAFYWLFIWMAAFSIFTQYMLTNWIITTTRIVDIEQYGFFSRRVSSFLLNRVQDVTTEVEGLVPTLFSFGTLNVETAGRDEKFQMEGIAHPEDLRDLIMREIAALHADGSSHQESTGV